MSLPPHGADVGECENCGLERHLTPCNTPHGEGSFCAECRNVREDLEEIEEDNNNFDCWTCGGSGGHPDTGCPACGGSGIDRRAMKHARDEARADQEDY